MSHYAVSSIFIEIEKLSRFYHLKGYTLMLRLLERTQVKFSTVSTIMLLLFVFDFFNCII